MMLAHWRPDGHTVPNADVYPWQWLWDSCFHALIWAELGEPERAVTELRSALADQDELGFVPHIRYAGGPSPHAEFWGRPATSSITQPPMYGHAVAELERRGIAVPDDVRERAVRGLRFLLDHRRRTADRPGDRRAPVGDRLRRQPALGPLVSTADGTPPRWYDVKGALLATVERAAGGAPLANPAFARGAGRLQRARRLERGGGRPPTPTPDELAEALDARWDDDRDDLGRRRAVGRHVRAGAHAGRAAARPSSSPRRAQRSGGARARSPTRRRSAAPSGRPRSTGPSRRSIPAGTGAVRPGRS